MSTKTIRYRGVPLPSQSVINRVITVAPGVFAPGHLGELTQIVPFEMVDAVLAETGGAQDRVRKLPSRVVVYHLLAAGLFEGLGYQGVWRKLVAGLGGLGLTGPSATALWHARVRIGVKPMKSLFDLLRGPASTIATAGARWRGLQMCAIDGTVMTAPDSEENRRRLGKQGSNHGGAGYPQLRLAALVGCGARGVIDAAWGPLAVGETTLAHRLLGALRPGMILLTDRNFDGNAFLAAVAATGADLLARLKTNRKLPILKRYGDGSYLSRIGELTVRIIECQITISTPAGKQTGLYRLATSLLDHHRYPAFELVKLYHERWEIETAYLELKSTLLGGRVLRSRTTQAVEQELYALLTAYQILRIAITDATDTDSRADPDRASFTIALQTARDQIINAANVIAGTTIDLVGAIGRNILDNLMPARRLRVSPRAVKRPLSRYAYKSLAISRTSYKATISIDIIGPACLTTTTPP